MLGGCDFFFFSKVVSLNTVVRNSLPAAKSLQSCPTLCDPINISPLGCPAPGILQARTLEWVAISFSNAWKWKSESEVAQLCPTLSDPMDCSLPGSSIHGVLQAKVLEWGAIWRRLGGSLGNKLNINFWREYVLNVREQWIKALRLECYMNN